MAGLAVALSGAGRYLHWGVITISLTNLLIIVAMIVLFVLAILVPFPRHQDSDDDQVSRS